MRYGPGGTGERAVPARVVADHAEALRRARRPAASHIVEVRAERVARGRAPARRPGPRRRGAARSGHRLYAVAAACAVGRQRAVDERGGGAEVVPGSSAASSCGVEGIRHARLVGQRRPERRRALAAARGGLLDQIVRGRRPSVGASRVGHALRHQQPAGEVEVRAHPLGVDREPLEQSRSHAAAAPPAAAAR